MKNQKKSFSLINEGRELTRKRHYSKDGVAQISIAHFVAHLASVHEMIVKDWQARDTLYRVANEYERRNGEIDFGVIPYRSGTRFGGIMKIDIKNSKGKELYFDSLRKRTEYLKKIGKDHEKRLTFAQEKGLLTREEFKRLTSTSILLEK